MATPVQHLYVGHLSLSIYIALERLGKIGINRTYLVDIISKGRKLINAPVLVIYLFYILYPSFGGKTKTKEERSTIFPAKRTIISGSEATVPRGDLSTHREHRPPNRIKTLASSQHRLSRLPAYVGSRSIYLPLIHYITHLRQPPSVTHTSLNVDRYSRR